MEHAFGFVHVVIVILHIRHMVDLESVYSTCSPLTGACAAGIADLSQQYMESEELLHYHLAQVVFRLQDVLVGDGLYANC